MQEAAIQPLLRVKRVITTLKAIDQSTLTAREQHALRDSLEQAYARAAYFLVVSGAGQSQEQQAR